MTALSAPTVLARGGGRALEKITSLNIWSGGINDVSRSNDGARGTQDDLDTPTT